MEQQQQSFYDRIVAHTGLDVNNKKGEKLKNQDIRDHAKTRGVMLWQIAEELGITDSSFSRKLRHELTSEERQRIISIIYKLECESA